MLNHYQKLPDVDPGLIATIKPSPYFTKDEVAFTDICPHLFRELNLILVGLKPVAIIQTDAKLRKLLFGYHNEGKLSIITCKDCPITIITQKGMEGRGKMVKKLLKHHSKNYPNTYPIRMGLLLGYNRQDIRKYSLAKLLDSTIN